MRLISNVGHVDRVLRLTFGAAALYAGYVASSYLWAGLGLVLALSAAIGFCPLYSLIGLSTARRAFAGRSSARTIL